MIRRALLVLAIALPLVAAASAGAVAKYSNCAKLNIVFPHGVARSGAVDLTKGVAVTTFAVNSALYKSLPKTLDRDKDGIACEKA